MPSSHKPRPSATTFWSNYPNYTNYTGPQAWNKVGPWLSTSYGNSNSCAARVSYGLNYGGQPIPSNSEFQTNKNNDGKRYIIDASKLRAYLNDKWGAPDYKWPGTISNIADLRSKLGTNDVAIVAYTGHIGVVTPTYNDQYTPYTGTGDVYIIKP
jgi:hypothetical protein